ncbi:thioredoxin domain-containing protein [Prevotella sp. 10(H)]|uniref:DsbA family protein n=1 Tax=Prevotella sp. 10(H) TaxID=1158294 RepID=UPI000AA8278A|nr:thioredoxin domain-containing protein [Prevotella sp. 10(H)]
MSANLKINKKDHIKGNENASVEILEYADYQCPYCRDAYFILKKLQNEFGQDIKFVFRNFPLTELHQYALHAALAAESAALQGKFWEMHDILLEQQENLQDEDILKYAQEIGLDITKFKHDFESDEVFNKVEADFESAEEYGVNATPTIYINGEKYKGDWMNAGFFRYIKSLI